MIKNVIFDIGRVLMDWHPDLTVMFDKDTAVTIRHAIWKTGYWDEMDHGVEPDEVNIAKMYQAAPDYAEQIDYTLDHLDLLADRLDYAIPWIDELKEKGYKVYFLSNYNRILRGRVPEVLDFLPHMDGGVFSCDVKLMKPHADIYDYLCKSYDLVPGECLFIDDKEENVQAAMAYGMQSILLMRSL